MSKLDNLNMPRDHPQHGRRFYAIEPREDGLVDVYLAPVLCVYETDLCIREYDIRIKVVRGIVPWAELEDDIRARYDAWCGCGEEVNL